MRTIKGLCGAPLACLLAIGFQGSSFAQPASGSAQAAATIEERARQTERSLLQALIERRAEIERAGTAEERATLPVIDRRIAEVKSRIG